MSESSKQLRQIELEAYAAVVTALRAQGELTKEKRKLLQDLQKSLNISFDRHRAEVRRALNDEDLQQIALDCTGSKADEEWMLDSKRVLPLMPRVKPRTAFSRSKTVLDVIWKEKKVARKHSPDSNSSSSILDALHEDKHPKPTTATSSAGPVNRTVTADIKALYGRKRSNSSEDVTSSEPVAKSSVFGSERNTPRHGFNSVGSSIGQNKVSAEVKVFPGFQDSPKGALNKPIMRAISQPASAASPVHEIAERYTASFAQKTAPAFLTRGTVMKIPATSPSQGLISSAALRGPIKPQVNIKSEPRLATGNLTRATAPMSTSATNFNSQQKTTSAYLSSGVLSAAKKVLSPVTGPSPRNSHNYENELMSFLIKQDMQMHRSSAMQQRAASDLRSVHERMLVDEDGNHYADESYSGYSVKKHYPANWVYASEQESDTHSDSTSVVAEEVIISGNAAERGGGRQYVRYVQAGSDVSVKRPSSLSMTSVPATVEQAESPSDARVGEYAREDGQGYYMENGMAVVECEVQYDAATLGVPESVHEINESHSQHSVDCGQADMQGISRTLIETDTAYNSEHAVS
jgi:hypothetical protein